MISITVDKSQFNIDKIYSDIEKRTENLVNDIAEAGRDIARTNFDLALYAGHNDAEVIVEPGESGEISKSIVATGTSVLFIEFGTGILYPDRHPQSAEFGFVRGTYGKGQGANQKGWFYQGEAGELGEPAKNPKLASRGLMHTYGNPANMCMYDTAKELKARMAEFVERSFEK